MRIESLPLSECKSSSQATVTSLGKSTIDDFEILGLIGEGSFGRVFHVVKKEDGNEYALKVMNKKDCNNIKGRIQREK